MARNRYWLYIAVAAFFEVLWVVGLKHADRPLEWLLTAVGIFVSFYTLIQSGKVLPASTVYALFVGLGTFGTTLVEVVFFHESLPPEKALFLALLLAGIIGLKQVSDVPEQEGSKEKWRGSH